MRADPVLVWYFGDSARELGMRASPMSAEPQSNTPQQKWPSAAMCRSARKQTQVKKALRQLSPRLQCILEATYTSTSCSINEKAEYDLAAPLIATVLNRMKYADAGDKKRLKTFIKNLPGLLEAAHGAFRIAYGPDEPKSRPEARRERVTRWMADEGLAA